MKIEKKYQKKIIIWNKLIRDRIPAIIIKRGANPEVKAVSKKEAVRLLKEKILEEGQELLETNNRLEMKKEMSDILEIIHSLSEELGIPYRKIEILRKKRAKERGRFKKRLYLIKTKKDK